MANYEAMRDLSVRRYILKLTEAQYEHWEKLRLEHGLNNFSELIDLGLDILTWVQQQRIQRKRQTRGRLKAMIRRRK